MVLGLSFLFPLTTTSAETNQSQRIYDEAGLLTPKEIETFEQEINQIRETYQTDIVIYTTLSTNGKDLKHFAADFYDNNDFGVGDTKDGLIYLIDMGSRKFQPVTTGHTIAVLNDNRLENIRDEISEPLSEENYGEAISTILTEVSHYLEKGPANGYQYNPETGQSEKVKYISISKVVIALIIALVSGVLFYIKVTSTYNLKKSSYHYPYRNMSQVTITDSQSVKTADFVTTRHIPKPPSNSGGGGSSTFTGSSGTSHGGGGGGSF